MSEKQRLQDLVEQLPASGIEPAVEFLEALVVPPIDSEMLARIDAARQERRSGVPHGEVTL